jgi:hypothetical protein
MENTVNNPTNYDDDDDQIQQTQSGVKNQSQSQSQVTRNKRQRRTEQKELESRKRAKEMLEVARQQRREARKLVKESQSANRRGPNGSVKLRKTVEEEKTESTESTTTTTTTSAIVTTHDALGPSIVIAPDEDEPSTSYSSPPPALLPLKTSVPEVNVSSSSPDNKRIDIIPKEPYEKTKGGFPMIHHVIKNGDEINVQYDKMPGNPNDIVIPVPKNANIGFVMTQYRKGNDDGRLIAQDLHTKRIYWEGPTNASYGILSNRATMNGNTGMIFNIL